jgi:RNase P/RNase MRP subunit p29
MIVSYKNKRGEVIHGFVVEETDKFYVVKTDGIGEVCVRKSKCIKE